MPFASSVERWRGLMRQYGSEIPPNFLLAWIDHESDGRPHVQTHLDERGIFQIHPSEAESLGIPSSQFDALLTESPPPSSGALNVTLGLKMVRMYMKRADARLREVGASWGRGRSYWTFVKLHHGSPLVAKESILAFKARRGRAPYDWDELHRATMQLVSAGDPALSPTTRSLAGRVMGNATKIAAAAGLREGIFMAGMGDSVGLAAVLLGIWYFGDRQRYHGLTPWG